MLVITMIKSYILTKLVFLILFFNTKFFQIDWVPKVGHQGHPSTCKNTRFYYLNKNLVISLTGM